MIEISNSLSGVPTTLDGAPLDHNCLHCQLALPIQHFMDRHPDKSKQQIVTELTEVLAEVLAACSENWPSVESYGRDVVNALELQTRKKFRALTEYRRKHR